MLTRLFAQLGPRLCVGLGSAMLMLSQGPAAVQAVPVAAESGEGFGFVEEIPEEILRTEIITGARSPLTGEPLSADEYARLQDALEEPAGGNIASSDIRYLIFLLQVRQAVRPIVPFIP